MSDDPRHPGPRRAMMSPGADAVKSRAVTSARRGEQAGECLPVQRAANAGRPSQSALGSRLADGGVVTPLPHPRRTGLPRAGQLQVTEPELIARYVRWLEDLREAGLTGAEAAEICRRPASELSG